jgi:hypothetical protein
MPALQGETVVAAVLGDLHLTPKTMPAFQEARMQIQVCPSHKSLRLTTQAEFMIRKMHRICPQQGSSSLTTSASGTATIALVTLATQ